MTTLPDRPATIEQFLEHSWKIALAVGISSVVLGIVVMVWPDATVLAIAILIGLQLIISGVYRLVAAVGGVTSSPWLIAVVGVLLLIGGVVALRNPGGTVFILALIVGLSWLISGIVMLVATLFSSGYPHRGWMLLNSIISTLAGVIVLAQPDISLSTLAWISGLFLVIGGVSLVFEAFAIKPASN